METVQISDKKKTKLILASKQLMKAGVASLLKPDNDKIASKPNRVGLWIVIVFVVGFGLWALDFVFLGVFADGWGYK